MSDSWSKPVAEALLEIGAVGFRPDQPIEFKSGILSPVYVDNRSLAFHPAAWHVVIQGFKALIEAQSLTYDVIAGVAVGGVPHSSALAYELQKPSVFIRKEAKEHGTQKLVEGGVVKGKRVLLVEDLVTTGGSSLKAVQALRDEGAIVEHMLTIVSYNFAEAQTAFDAAKVHLHTLTTFPVILEAATGNQLNGDQVAVVRDWLADPHGWAKRQGHS